MYFVAGIILALFLYVLHEISERINKLNHTLTDIKNELKKQNHEAP